MAPKIRYRGFLRQTDARDATGGEQARLSLSDTEATTFGRSTTCEIVLDSTLYSGVSRNHAQICPCVGDSTGWQISDLGSANGTFINGRLLEDTHLLQDGDRIMLGQNGPEFRFEMERIRLSLSRPNSADARGDAMSLTQLLPITSTGSDLLDKAYLIPGALTVIFVVGMFSTAGRPLLFNLLLALYLTGAGYFFIYRLCGKQKPWWVVVGAALSTCLLLSSPLMDLLFSVFRYWLPGDTDALIERIRQGEAVGFIEQLTTFFFGAGLLEELVKALPVLGAYLLGSRLRTPWRESLGVLEPLDGILLGAACGMGFTLFETLVQYVPATIMSITAQAGTGAGEMAGLQLLIPRLIGNVSGHMAYSGYLGYFIGLGALKRSATRRWSIILIGYLSAALLHALWNSAGVLGDPALALVGVTAFAFLMAAILKARQLSPNRARNFATQVTIPREDLHRQ